LLVKVSLRKDKVCCKSHILFCTFLHAYSFDGLCLTTGKGFFQQVVLLMQIFDGFLSFVDVFG